MFAMGIAERKSRQKQALRERILDAARRIVMREGFAALSMRKIADAIEYSPATLYLHFASRDEIAHALCAEGYAQLLETFVPLAGIVDPAERLRALGRAYVAFGVAHPETYRLIFMEDQSYMGAALGGAAALEAARAGRAGAPPDSEAVLAAQHLTPADTTATNTTASGTAATSAGDANSAAVTVTAADDDAGAAALHLMITALEELKAAGRLPASTDAAVWAEAFWATLHGIVALNLTCPVFPTAPLDTVVGVALDAWLGTSPAVQHPAPRTTRTPRRVSQPRSGASTAVAGEKKPQDMQTPSSADPGSDPSSATLDSQPAKTPPNRGHGPGAKGKPTST